ncbi:CotD family spore coat protein [Ureibacillus aquaedulcis]|uniref:CotD family spore coat protein n=1 Tax=Ureibacillus aquaedulcis TaxID=3058421 RepID=A0ABT8GLZ8_9BACL|nr:CotD family spore coat protein [Ureibacillus sp. BA0131]MDN4492438.1 CotD family spore coat protein [Ureibacillus sp. BA0131]
MNRRHHCGGRCNNPICCPPNVFPTQVAPARISPTQHIVKTNIFNTVVPHCHPVHTTTVNRHNTHHQHFFPRTESVVNEFTETQEFFPPYNAGTVGNMGAPVRRRRGFFNF